MNVPTSIAGHYGISEKMLKRIFDGRQRIGPTIAQRLCNMTHIGAPFWLALEHNFRVGLAAGKTWVGKEESL
jgi:plasmid maintenance system antidote protein VapI